MLSTRRSSLAAFCLFFIASFLITGLQAAEKPSGDTVVYLMPGKNRVHLATCRRLPKDQAELAKYTKMTLKDAEAKGLELCSKCPGSTTPGREKK